MHCDQGFVKNNPKEGRKFMKVCQITRIQHIILHDSQTFYLTVDGRNLFEVYCSACSEGMSSLRRFLDEGIIERVLLFAMLNLFFLSSSLI